jgi:molecular chaperone DnaK (HSP70)
MQALLWKTILLALQEGDNVLVGHAAKTQGLINPFNTFHSVKRLIGRSYQEVQAELPSLTYAVVEAFDGSAEIWCPAWWVSHQSCH